MGQRLAPGTEGESSGQQPPRRVARRRQDRGEGGLSPGRSLASTGSLQGVGRKILIKCAGRAVVREGRGKEEPAVVAVVGGWAAADADSIRPDPVEESRGV
nr:unnamed protein product [Digitaria exilis]